MDEAANQEITYAMGLKVRNVLFKEQIQKAMSQGGGNLTNPRRRPPSQRKAVPSLVAELVDEPGHGEEATGTANPETGHFRHERMDDQAAPST